MPLLASQRPGEAARRRAAAEAREQQQYNQAVQQTLQQVGCRRVYVYISVEGTAVCSFDRAALPPLHRLPRLDLECDVQQLLAAALVASALQLVVAAVEEALRRQLVVVAVVQAWARVHHPLRRLLPQTGQTCLTW